MQKNKKESIKYMQKSKKGITLIALVVTIVVLLILAGITINLLFSDTGLFGKAGETENAWRNGEQSDINAIGALVNELNEIMNGTGTGGSGTGGGVTPDDTWVAPTTVSEAIQQDEIFEETTTITDAYDNVITIPKGFKVSNEATTVPEGIVIEDGTGTETTTGNQFVWIPVGTVHKDNNPENDVTIQLGRYTFDTSTGNPTPVQLAYTDDNPTNYTAEVEIAGYSDNHIELDESRTGVASSGLDGENATAKSLADFVDSVRINGGYYLARYEASYGSGYSSEGATDAEKYANAKPLSKQSTANNTDSMSYDSGTLWNFITQLNASKVCQNMYANDSSVGVESDLVNSYAWDTAIVFIQEMYETNSNYANANRNTTENSSLMDTGTTGDEVCNIFDMAANVAEWTTEYSTYTYSTTYAYPCTLRGGIYRDGSAYYTAIRHSNLATNSNSNFFGFRSVLYVK